MNTITITELKALLARSDWEHDDDVEIIDRVIEDSEDWDAAGEELVHIEITFVWGAATVTSRLGDIEIVYTEGFSFDEGYEDSFSAGTEGQDSIWELSGVTVVDDDGDELDIQELADLIPEKFSEVDYSGLEITREVK